MNENLAALIHAIDPSDTVFVPHLDGLGATAGAALDVMFNTETGTFTILSFISGRRIGLSFAEAERLLLPLR